MKNPFARAHEIAAQHRKVLEKPKALSVRAEDGSRGSLYVYEVIGYDWWTGGGLTGKSVAEALQALGDVKALDVFINSEGGDVFEAKAILTQLQRCKAEKTVHVDGICASAASFIAMCGDKIITAPHATWMVHEAWAGAVGRADDMRAMAALLDLENQTIAETYARRTGKTAEEMRAVMAAETWMNATTALELGFTDEVAGEADCEKCDCGDTPADGCTCDCHEQEAAAAKASPLVAAAAQTQERLRAARIQDSKLAAQARRLKEITSRGNPEKRSA